MSSAIFTNGNEAYQVSKTIALSQIPPVLLR
jgi:hypothetical protein